MEIILGLVVAVSIIGGAVGFFLPRFSEYFLGPVALVFALLVLSFAHKFMFHSVVTDGSPAGLLAPAIAWLAFGSGALFGCILVFVGSREIRRARPGIAPTEKSS
jgi:hypothetical protein